MLQAFLGEIRGVFDKDFLFGSFVPSLVFLASIGATIGGVIGFDGSLGWINTLNGAETTVLVGVSFLGILVFAYIVNSLRVEFLKLWTGASKGLLTPFLWLGEQRNRARYEEEAEAAYRVPRWKTVLDKFKHNIQQSYNRPGVDQIISAVALAELKTMIGEARLDGTPSPQDVTTFLDDKVLPLFQKHVWTDDLNGIYQQLVIVLGRKVREEEVEISSKRFRLDRLFGNRDNIRGTTLGNVVESYNTYPFTRYGMEGEIFWPHLQHHVPEPFLKRVRELKIILDFCLTMATLGVCYGLLAVLVGPLLWSYVLFWVVLGLFAVCFSYLAYYRLAVFVATQYGDMIRACFDMFRRELFKAFSLKLEDAPTTLLKEREVWGELSGLLVYGDPISLTFEIPRNTQSTSQASVRTPSTPPSTQT